MPKFLYSLPNLLSFYRIAIVPVLFVLFLYDSVVTTWINVFLFFLACVSDYLDGVIARKTGQTSIFGKFIDHTSDKILIGCVMMLLVAFQRLEGIWIACALIIFSREILIAGLRDFLGKYNVDVPISWMGKAKTAVQMVASGFIMAGEHGDAVIPYSYDIGKLIFLIATVMTVVSGWGYMKAGLETLKRLETEKG